MNATANTTATASIHRLEAGARLGVRLKNYRGDMTLPHPFTLGSVAEYAARYNEDQEAAVERSRRLGHNLYYAISEGVMISAHPQEVVERIEVSLGDIIEMDGQQFTVTPAANQNIDLVPLAVA